MKRGLIDAGNTRVKWAVVQADETLASGSIETDSLTESALREIDWHGIPEVWLCNVAGAAVEQKIQWVCDAKKIPLHIIQAQPTQCGVRNLYQYPAQLGADRWATLIAAWQQVHGACVVVNCGTATTIDSLSAQGEFLGGLILPGITLLQNSLLDATAQLRVQGGVYRRFPQTTADAIYSGALQATRGAIERQYKLLDDAQAPLLLSGGAAAQLYPWLESSNIPQRMMDNLVLQGLLLIAKEASMS